MYTDYFGLADAPFSIAPNPQFLYMSERHREALAHLLYGIKSDGGFILLTGEVGTGKTTVCRCLLEQIPEDVDTAFVLNPKQTAIELLASVCDDLGIAYPWNATIKILVDRLSEFLLAAHNNGRRTVLIIDEAQNLTVDVLEQLRLLTNLETNQRKLLQIILLGQPELLEKLERKELRQLAQRVTARFHLDALSPEEVVIYIRHRLDVAGCKSELFQPAAVARICKLSLGVPRLINLICDRALLGAYARNQRHVDKRIVDQAAAEIFGEAPKPHSGRRALGIAAVLAVLSVASVAYLADKADIQVPGFEQHAAVTVAAKDPLSKAAKAAPAASQHAVTKGAAVATATNNPHKSPAATSPKDAHQQLTPVAVVQRTSAPKTDALIEVEGDSSAGAAMAQLFKLWGLPLKATGGSPCQQAKEFGLACLMELGSLHDIAHLDRPAVIDLSIAGIDNFLALTGFDGHIVNLVSSNGSYRIRQSDLVANWNGNYAILWKPPPDYRVVKQGDKGLTVDWLYRQLAIIDGDKTAPSVGKPFSAALEQRLKQFQIAQGLKPDGIANADTWIHINTLVDKDVPHLNESAGG